MAKNLILWMIIAGVLLTVFNNINQESPQDEIYYSDFLREVRSGRVTAVEIAGVNITGMRSDNSQFRTLIPLIGDDQLIDELLQNDVDIVAEEPEQQSIWTQLLVASFPILIIIALFFFFMRQMQGGGAGGKG
ncbi:MAG: ATP-dependent metallopeptidase FtsH/Yme1/Tma family protein, partial [Gimesia chilikensis]